MVGKPPSANLFKENNPEGKHSLADWREKFIEISDPTEYKAALILAGSWAGWCTIKKHWPYFRDVILQDWLAEVEIKLRSDAIKEIIDQSKDEKGTAAAKWVAEGRYNPRKTGAPTKAEKQREARIAAGVEKEVEDDINRVLEFVKPRA